MNLKCELVLASKSRDRWDILNNAGIPFTYVDSEFDESTVELKPVDQYVKELAIKKCQNIEHAHMGKVILTADTVLSFRHEIIGKPKSRIEAYDILKKLSDNTHNVFTGYHIQAGYDIITTNVCTSTVTFRKLTDDMIKWYINTGESINRCVYAIQGIASIFIAGIHGSYSNVVGLPISSIIRDLDKVGLIKWTI